jgi:hypothetical protein
LKKQIDRFLRPITRTYRPQGCQARRRASTAGTGKQGQVAGLGIEGEIDKAPDVVDIGDRNDIVITLLNPRNCIDPTIDSQIVVRYGIADAVHAGWVGHPEQGDGVMVFQVEAPVLVPEWPGRLLPR